MSRPDFVLANGAPSRFKSRPKVTRSFCGACGTSLTYETDDHPDEIDVTICSLDVPDAVLPDDHTRVADKLIWSDLCDGRPTHRLARAVG